MLNESWSRIETRSNSDLEQRRRLGRHFFYCGNVGIHAKEINVNYFLVFTDKGVYSIFLGSFRYSIIILTTV
jgi:hypothetical protein